MRKIAYILFMLLALPVWGQFHEPVHFSVKQQKLSDTEFEVVFTSSVEPGWHVYGSDIKDGGPTRAELTLEHQRGVRPLGGLRATGKVQRMMDPMFDMEVSYMEGNASFAQKFAITEPSYEVSGYLTYGACNEMNCLPPMDVEFSFEGKGPDSSPKEEAKTVDVENLDNPDSLGNQKATEDSVEHAATLWSPVIDELKAYSSDTSSLSEERKGASTLWWIFLMGFLGGFAALLTPCVWPIIPMTVSFFLKRGGKEQGARSKGIRDAMLYGLSIIVIYMALGLLVTLVFGASALNALSTNAVFNIFFFLLLVLFGVSFLGGFEITLPSRWANAVDSKATKTTGLLSIFLMAFTLALVSFSCTGPIIGFLLVEVATMGNLVGPAVGMFGFALALALPFTLFALFPSWLKSAPKSGNWMNCIKVTLGFLELAFSLKFLSVADLAYGWHILDREVFLCLWIVLFVLLGAYLIGWLRFPHDEEEYDEAGEAVLHARTSVTRFLLALVSFAFALYMVPGLWGAPCKAVSAFAPPMSTQDFNLNNEEKSHFTDYEEGMNYAKAQGKPVLLDFTGYGCVNCRKMEAAVWTHPEVQQLMDEHYVVISLWVDEKTKLAEPLDVEEMGEHRKLRTVGDKWSYLQRTKFGANAQPFYVVVNPDGHPLNAPYGYDEDVAAYVRFLKTGMEHYYKP